MFLKNNAEDGVRDCTRRAASILHNKSTKDPVEALKPLVEMKGVGPATASGTLYGCICITEMHVWLIYSAYPQRI